MNDRPATPTAPTPSPAELASLALDVADFLVALTRSQQTAVFSRITTRAWIVAEALKTQAAAERAA